jgi:hypothetical protein
MIPVPSANILSRLTLLVKQFLQFRFFHSPLPAYSDRNKATSVDHLVDGLTGDLKNLGDFFYG